MRVSVGRGCVGLARVLRESKGSSTVLNQSLFWHLQACFLARGEALHLSGQALLGPQGGAAAPGQSG